MLERGRREHRAQSERRLTYTISNRNARSFGREQAFSTLSTLSTTRVSPHSRSPSRRGRRLPRRQFTENVDSAKVSNRQEADPPTPVLASLGRVSESSSLQPHCLTSLSDRVGPPAGLVSSRKLGTILAILAIPGPLPLPSARSEYLSGLGPILRCIPAAADFPGVDLAGMRCISSMSQWCGAGRAARGRAREVGE